MGEKLVHGGEREPDKVYKERIPAAAVAHTVTWVNTALNRKGSGSPYKFKKGEHSPLGLFLVNTEAKDGPPIETHLTVTPGHGRAAILGRVIFKDAKGRHYCYVDTKGAGHVLYPDMLAEGETIGAKAETPMKSGERGPDVYGIAGAEDSLKEAMIGEDLARAGVRTVRVLAILKLEEILTADGKKIPVEEALQTWYKSEAHHNRPANHPVICLRVYGVQGRTGEHHRINELPGNDADRKDRVTRIVEDALEFVETYEYPEGEEKREGAERIKKYLLWFTTSLGENVARLHKAGYYHGQIAPYHAARVPSNVTLDGRFVDFDTSGKFVDVDDIEEEESHREMDIFAALGAVDDLMKTLAYAYGDKAEFAFLATERTAPYDSTWFTAAPWIREEFLKGYNKISGKTLTSDEYS